MKTRLFISAGVYKLAQILNNKTDVELSLFDLHIWSTQYNKFWD